MQLPWRKRTQLISMYDQLDDKSRAQLDRQLQLAQQVLAVTDIIDPGLTPRRGGLLKHVLELRTRTANMDKMSSYARCATLQIEKQLHA